MDFTCLLSLFLNVLLANIRLHVCTGIGAQCALLGSTAVDLATYKAAQS